MASATRPQIGKVHACLGALHITERAAKLGVLSAIVYRPVESSVDPELFYPFDGGSPREALAICERCPVVAECLALALKMEADGSYCFGVWGGKSANQRRHMIRSARGETCPSCGYPFRDLARHRQMSLACHLVAR